MESSYREKTTERNDSAFDVKQEDTRMVTIDNGTCIGCGLCVKDCPGETLKLDQGKAKLIAKCIQCGHCVAICPVGAVSILAYDMADVEDTNTKPFAFDVDQLLYTIKCRRSMRQYAPQPVEREKLEKMIQAGRYTATAMNRQACRFIVVQDELDKLKEMVWEGIDAVQVHPEDVSQLLQKTLKNLSEKRSRGIDFLFRNAPAVVYIAGDNVVDASLAAQNMEMAAISQGLAVLYNGYLVRTTEMNGAVREWIGAADKPIAVCMLVGYPGVEYKRTAPRRLADTVWR